MLVRGAGADQEAFGIQTLGPSVLALEAEIPLQVDADRFTVATRSVAGVVSVRRSALPAPSPCRAARTASAAGATVTFDGAGASRLVIDADAVASISVEGPEGERRPLTFRGAQGMVLRDGPQGLRFQMAGPFTVTDATGAELTVEGSGEGLLDPARSELDLRLAGRSTYRSGETELVMGSATLRHLAGDLQMLQLEAEGGVEARARATDGDLVELLADAWSLELRGEAPRILWADAVQARSLSAQRARCAAWRTSLGRARIPRDRGVQWASRRARDAASADVRGDGLEITAPGRPAPPCGSFLTAAPRRWISRRCGSMPPRPPWRPGGCPLDDPPGDSGCWPSTFVWTSGWGPRVRPTVLAERGERPCSRARAPWPEAEQLELPVGRNGRGHCPESFRASGRSGPWSRSQGLLRIEADALEGSGAAEARATALPGRRVRAEGLLPGTEDPFVLAADEITVGAESVRATRVELELANPRQVARASSSVPRGHPRLLAELLTIAPTETVSSGVLVETRTSRESRCSWRHSSSDSPQDLQDVETVTLDSLKAVDAEGAVRLRYGDGAVEASALRMDAQRFRVTGNPVVLESMGYEVRTDLVELDLTDFLSSWTPAPSRAGWSVSSRASCPTGWGTCSRPCTGSRSRCRGRPTRTTRRSGCTRAAGGGPPTRRCGVAPGLDLEEDPGQSSAPLFESELVNNTSSGSLVASSPATSGLHTSPAPSRWTGRASAARARRRCTWTWSTSAAGSPRRSSRSRSRSAGAASVCAPSPSASTHCRTGGWSRRRRR